MHNGKEKEIVIFKKDVCKIHYGGEPYLVYYEYILEERCALLCRHTQCFNFVEGITAMRRVARIIEVCDHANGYKKGNIGDIRDNPREYKAVMKCVIHAVQFEQLDSVDDLLCAPHRAQSLNTHPLGSGMKISK